MPQLRKLSTIAIKEEATEGSMVAINSANDAKYLVSEVQYRPETTKIERDPHPTSFARKPGVIAIRLARISFTTELVGSGDPSPDTEPTWGLLLKACGFKATATASTKVDFDPVTNAVYGLAFGNVTITIWVYEDGIVKKARGCRGTVKFRGEAGNLCFADWEFLGVHDSVADAAYPPLSTGYDASQPPILESANFTFQGISGICFRSFEIDIGNTIVPRFCANSVSGVNNIFISDRLVKGTIDPEQVLVSVFDPLTNHVGGIVGAFDLTIGTVIGNKIQFSAPAAQVMIDNVEEAERDGILTNTLSLSFNTPLLETPTDKEIRITTK